MSRARSSLRSRLMWGLSLTTCLLWGSVAAWQFTSMQRELRAMLDDRLIASAKMVADIVQQIHPDPQAPITPAASNAPSEASGEGFRLRRSMNMVFPLLRFETRWQRPGRFRPAEKKTRRTRRRVLEAFRPSGNPAAYLTAQ